MVKDESGKQILDEQKGLFFISKEMIDDSLLLAQKTFQYVKNDT